MSQTPSNAQATRRDPLACLLKCRNSRSRSYTEAIQTPFMPTFRSRPKKIPYSWFQSEDPSVARVPARSLRPPDNLHHISPFQPQIPRNRIAELYPRQLRLLQSVSIQQHLLLLIAEQHMSRHELVLRDIDQQVLLSEMLSRNAALVQRFECAESSRRDGAHGDEDADGEFVGVEMLREVADVLDADRLLAAEFDPNRTGPSHRIGFRFRGHRGVSLLHFFGRGGLKFHEFASGGGQGQYYWRQNLQSSEAHSMRPSARSWNFS